MVGKETDQAVQAIKDCIDEEIAPRHMTLREALIVLQEVEDDIRERMQLIREDLRG